MHASATSVNQRRNLAALCVAAACLLFAALPASSQADPSTRVIQGTVVPNNPSEWPYIVALTDKTGHNFCGGTMIAPYWVLTAAHCGEADFIIFGRKTLTDTSVGEKIPVIEHYLHDDWNPDNLANDIQLMRIDHPPANLAVAEMAVSADDPVGGDTVNLAGWGVTEFSNGDVVKDLREASLETFSNNSCGLNWGSIGVSIFPTQLCAAHWGAAPEDDRQACNGDSGGPLMFSTPGGDRLVGVVSFGRPGCNGNPFPNVYTRVSSFGPWVDGMIGSRASLNVSSVLFASTPIGSAPVMRSIKIISTGTGAVVPSNVSVAGATDFSVLPGSCIDQVLPPGEACSITVKYSPISQGLTSGILKVTYPGGETSVDLNAYGTIGSAPPVIAPLLTLSQSGKAKAAKGKLKVSMKASFAIPANVNQTTACANNLLLTATVPRVRKSLKTQGPASWAMGRCLGRLTLKLPKKAKGKKVKFTLRFVGNTTLAAAEKQFKLRIK